MEAINFLTALWLGFLGACIGSFLNVVAYRLPRGMSVIWRPSHCPRCDRPIRPYDNVPIFGWLWLGGRCRDCKAPISPRYAIVETALGAVAFLLASVELISGGANLPGGPLVEDAGALNTVWNPHGALLATYALHLLLMAAMTTIVLFDLDEQRTPKRFSVVVLIAMLLLICFADSYLPIRGSSSTDPDRFRHSYLAVVVVVALTAAHCAAAKVRNPAPDKLMPRRASNAFLAGALVFVALGLTVAASFLFLWISLSVIGKLAAGRFKAPWLSTTSAAWCAALLQIVFWRQLAAWTAGW